MSPAYDTVWLGGSKCSMFGRVVYCPTLLWPDEVHVYSATHKQLDSPRVSHTSRTRILEHVHASTRTRTCSHSNACTRFTRGGRASLVPKLSAFFRGGRGLGIDAIDTRSCVLRALVTRAHTRVTCITLTCA